MLWITFILIDWQTFVVLTVPCSLQSKSVEAQDTDKQNKKTCFETIFLSLLLELCLFLGHLFLEGAIISSYSDQLEALVICSP